MTDLKMLEAEIAKLDDAEQARLATDILARLHGASDDAGEAWTHEAVRRLDEIRRGDAPTFDADAVMSEARRRLVKMR